MFTRSGNIYAANSVTATFNQLLYFLGDSAYVLLVKPVFRDQDVQLVQIRLFAQPDKCVQRYIAVDAVLHARLGLANIMHAAGHVQGLFLPLADPDRYGVADLRMRYLKGVPLDQYFSCGRRPCAMLWRQPAYADTSVVFHHKDHQIAPLGWTAFDPAMQNSSWLGVAYVAVGEYSRDQFVINCVRPQSGGGRVRCQVSFVELPCEHCVRGKNGSEA